MSIGKSAEDYMETILLLGDHVHAVDIAQKLDISKAAVTKALKSLVGEGYVGIDERHVTLTDKGKNYAEKVYEKHRLLMRLWIKLGVERETAEKDACVSEHILSDETFAAIKKFVAWNNNDTEKENK